jgi:hypothetical protein
LSEEQAGDEDGCGFHGWYSGDSYSIG